MNERDPTLDDSYDEDRIEREADKLGSLALGRLRVGEEPLPSNQPEQTARSTPRARRRYNLSKNPDNDSDHDPNWRGGSYTKRTPEEQRSAEQGIAACRAALNKNKPSI